MILRWGFVGLGALAALGLAFLGWVYAASEWHYRSFPTPPAFTTPIPEDAASIAHGERLALTRGCGGCHGGELQGEFMWGGVVETPNLPALARSESAATLEAAIRHGVGRGGRALYSMPSYNFIRMRDEDVAALIAYLRSAPVSDAKPAGEAAPWHARARGFQHPLQHRARR